jgi:hypothetical protein
MATQLAIYNATLRHCRAARIATVSDTVESRRVLDDFYTDTIAYMLEMGFWKFAMNSVMIEADADLIPEFGFTNVFSRPSDFVKMYDISGDENFNCPLTQWLLESQGIFADVDPIYVKYVSNSTDYGGNLAIWPARFLVAFEWELAFRVAPRLTKGDDIVTECDNKRKEFLSSALSYDALDEAPKGPPTGRFVRSRIGQGTFKSWAGDRYLRG